MDRNWYQQNASVLARELELQIDRLPSLDACEVEGCIFAMEANLGVLKSLLAFIEHDCEVPQA